MTLQKNKKALTLITTAVGTAALYHKGEHPITAEKADGGMLTGAQTSARYQIKCGLSGN